jgi:CheY-like chemotaxis protein
MAISWKSDTKEIYEKVKYLIITYFSKELGGTDNNKIFSFYDTIAQAEDLRVLLRNKLLNIKKDKPYVITNKEGTKINIENYFTVKHKNALKASLLERKHRKETSILVVEDQEFSATLLMGLLRKYYKCYHAKNAKEAIDLYCEHAPNIAFLDIELPDLSGHYLAAIFNKCDPESFMVMVTANNFIKDVEVAKKNNVRGFIIKPYSKEKILSATKQYANKKV